MMVSARTQRIVICARSLIVLDAGSRPVIERGPEPALARIPHVDQQSTFPAAFRDGRGTGLSPQGAIITFGQRAGRFGEHRGGYHSSDPWQGLENLHVTMRAGLILRRRGGQCGQQLIDATLGRRPLPMQEPELRHERRDPGFDGIGDPRRHLQARPPESGNHLINGQSPNPMLAQRRSNPPAS